MSRPRLWQAASIPVIALVASVSVATAAGPPDLTGTTLTYWASATTNSDAIKSLIAGFEEQTGATVETVAFPDPFEQNLLTRWATGDRPDILNFHPYASWLLHLDPTNTLVDLSGEDFVGKTRFGMMETAGNVDGQHFAAVIQSPAIQGVWYNKALFNQAGLTIPTTLDEFWAACEQFNAAVPDKTFWFQGGGDVWPLQLLPGMLWADLEKEGKISAINDGTAKWSDPDIVERIQALNDAVTKGCLNDTLKTAGYNDELTNLMSGDAALITQGTWVIPSLLDANGLDTLNQTVGFFPLSMTGPTARWSVTDAFLVPKNSDAAKQEAALAFIRYVTGDGYQRYLDESGDMPVLEGYNPPGNVPGPLLEAHSFLDEATSNGMLLKAPFGDFHVFLSEMINGEKSAQDVGDAIQAAFEQAVEAIGQ
jgi:raffinose/stachyose/melibiose transport system substrate-binding protein